MFGALKLSLFHAHVFKQRAQLQAFPRLKVERFHWFMDRYMRSIGSINHKLNMYIYIHILYDKSH